MGICELMIAPPHLEAFLAIIIAAGSLYWLYRELWPKHTRRPKHVLTCRSCRTAYPVRREIKQTDPFLTNLSCVCIMATGGDHLDAMPLVRHHLLYWDPDTDDESARGVWEIVCGICGCSVALSDAAAKNFAPPDHPSIQIFGCLSGGRHVLRESNRRQN
jgi:hypothetical protein